MLFFFLLFVEGSISDVGGQFNLCSPTIWPLSRGCRRVLNDNQAVGFAIILSLQWTIIQ